MQRTSGEKSLIWRSNVQRARVSIGCDQELRLGSRTGFERPKLVDNASHSVQGMVTSTPVATLMNQMVRTMVL